MAFGGRASKILWRPSISPESWYNITPLLARPRTSVLEGFHLLFLINMIFTSELLWFHVFENALYSLWLPVFIEDLWPWKYTMFLIVTIESIAIATATINNLLIYMSIILAWPCVVLFHAVVILKIPTYTLQYEDRKERLLVQTI